MGETAQTATVKQIKEQINGSIKVTLAVEFDTHSQKESQIL